MDFLKSSKKVVSKDLVYVQETSAFIMDLMKQRSLDLFSTFVRISMIGGGGLLKVIVNVFDVDEDTESRYMNSGVQRCQILAIVEDAPESNYRVLPSLPSLH